MPNKKILFARHLRKQMTGAEKKLWQELRRSQLGARFRRQVPLGPYIADFACFEPRIIIEIDGDQHADNDAMIYDQQRTRWLQLRGYTVLRFWNNEVLKHMQNVKEEILKNLSPHPNLPPQGGRND